MDAFFIFPYFAVYRFGIEHLKFENISQNSSGYLKDYINFTQNIRYCDLFFLQDHMTGCGVGPICDGELCTKFCPLFQSLKGVVRTIKGTTIKAKNKGS